MREILREHFGRGVSEDPFLNDVWMTVAHKVRREHPKPEILYITLSPERRVELLRNPRALKSYAHSYTGGGADLLFGHPVYLDLELEGDEAGYRVVHLR